MAEQITLIEDTIGKAVVGAYEDKHAEYVTLRFADGSYLHVTIDQGDGCGDSAGLDLWREPFSPEAKHAAGLIDEAERDRMIAAAKATDERLERAQYERLKARYEPQATEAP